MALHSSIKEEAISLRKNGNSLKEISETLRIAKSTASAWLSKIDLSLEAQERLKEKQILGQYKAVVIKRRKNVENQAIATKKARLEISSLNFSPIDWKVYCALLWWCEGNKDNSMVRFTNSDPTLIQNFLYSLRTGFIIDEKKFRVLVHIHSYHNDIDQKTFWGNITRIPLPQFHASYKKTNTGKRTRENYQGCIAISYYDAKIAKELYALYNAFTHRGIR